MVSRTGALVQVYLSTAKNLQNQRDGGGTTPLLQPVFGGVDVEVVSTDTGLGLQLDDRQDWSYNTTPTNTTGISTDSFIFSGR